MRILWGRCLTNSWPSLPLQGVLRVRENIRGADGCSMRGKWEHLDDLFMGQGSHVAARAPPHQMPEVHLQSHRSETSSTTVQATVIWPPAGVSRQIVRTSQNNRGTFNAHYSFQHPNLSIRNREVETRYWLLEPQPEQQRCSHVVALRSVCPPPPPPFPHTPTPLE